MEQREVLYPPSVFSPDNEPYLGRSSVLAFDLAIPPALKVHAKIAPLTDSDTLTPLQLCGREIIPQGISLALSIRELIRQGYLFSAAVLLRPLIERVGLAQLMLQDPSIVTAWQNGWSRQDQPKFSDLLDILLPDADEEHSKALTKMFHKLVHVDPMSSLFNMFRKDDGSLAHSSSKMLKSPKEADVPALLATRCLKRLTAVSVIVFELNADAI